jgi:hypothetical protein
MNYFEEYKFCYNLILWEEYDISSYLWIKSEIKEIKAMIVNEY